MKIESNIFCVLKNSSQLCAIIIFALISVCSSSASAENISFYDGANKHKGFYWFETKKSKDNSKAEKEFHYPTPEEATQALAMRKKALDGARSQMIELSYSKDASPQVLREAIVKYKKLESEMYDGAIRLTYATEMANFTNPELANVAENPTNVFANKIKRKSDQEKRLVTVREFAKNFDLLVFTNNNCPYSRAFLPVITNFAEVHGFALEQTALAGAEGKIAQKLGITSTPTLIAVSKDSKEMFEISRSMISVSELEANILLSSKYSNEQRVQSKYQKSKRR
jgi:thiol-disulfide isomerase/thioredoxin